MKTTELNGALLDFWVARGEGVQVEICEDDGRCRLSGTMGRYDPSSNWALGGPIIEREAIATMPCIEDGRLFWIAAHSKVDKGINGNTPLIAAMRAYVVSRFGDEVPEL